MFLSGGSSLGNSSGAIFWNSSKGAFKTIASYLVFLVTYKTVDTSSILV